MANVQCISCNSPISDASKSCKCGHVNEAMRTIAGKRFSGYREELYTRRVIKESRDEYRRMKRESLGTRKRKRKSSTPEKLRLRRQRKKQDDMCTITSDSHDQLNDGLDCDNLTHMTSYTNGNHDNHTQIHLQDITADESNKTHDLLEIRDDLENDVHIDSSIGHVNECPSYKQYLPTTKTISHKRGPKKTTFNQFNRKTRDGCRENKTRIIRPMKQFAIAGPLAEINKRLMNQSGFWMCLGDGLGLSKPAAADVVLKEIL
ncbi:uncharacterized protein LOC116303453 isoform X1 [Actinia tenebrosa]|uniref:Uncharacterized protein LOC116303453 isoform X1 n=1 Tax=Actinia tenebrosa TaxID=6105 RepID=A0A6P8IPQ5_ACTTE|nr:uncharacterized protein LOC116303453 isoform X1 [Actinia tenebrosa]